MFAERELEFLFILQNNSQKTKKGHGDEGGIIILEWHKDFNFLGGGIKRAGMKKSCEL